MKKFFKYFWFLSSLDCMMISSVTNDEGGNDDEGNGKGGAEGAAELAAMKAELAQLRGESESLKSAKTELEQRLDEADKELLSDDFLAFKDGKSKHIVDHRGGADIDIDLDRVSNKELYAYIKKEYDGKLSAALKDFEQKLNLSKQEIGMISAQAEVQAAELRHDGRDGKPTFVDLRKDIYEIAKANPKWNAEKCYQQAILERKHNEIEQEEVKRKKQEDEERTATEKVGVPGAAANGKQLSKDEAARIAYRKAFGSKH